MVFGISLAIAKPKFCINAIGQEQTGLRAWAPPKENELFMRDAVSTKVTEDRKKLRLRVIID